MIDNSMMNEPQTGQPYVAGTTVFDNSGEKVGAVGEQLPLGDYLVVEKGWLFVHELYVPYSLVKSQDESGIYLGISKEELKEDRWKTPPTDTEAVATSMPVEDDMGDEVDDDMGDQVEVVEVVEVDQVDAAPDTLVEEGTDVREEPPHTYTQGESVIEQYPHTVSQGTASIEQAPDTYTLGTDSIEPTETAD
jgi:hypothetical protein